MGEGAVFLVGGFQLHPFRCDKLVEESGVATQVGVCYDVVVDGPPGWVEEYGGGVDFEDVGFASGTVDADIDAIPAAVVVHAGGLER